MNTFVETINHWGEIFASFAWPMLWQSSLLIAVAFALDFLLARKIRAAVRYALWLAVLAKLLLPPTLALPTGAAWWLFHAPPASPAPVHKSFTVTYDQTPLQTDLATPVADLAPAAPKLTGAGATLLVSAVVSTGLLFWLAFRWWQVTRIVRRAAVANEYSPLLEEALRLTESLERRHFAGVFLFPNGTRRQGAGTPSVGRALPRVASKPVQGKVPVHPSPGNHLQLPRLKITDDRLSPAVCGLFRPTLLLPRSLAETLSPAQLRTVLLHELFHLRRGDVWVNCVQALLQIAYWWHPLLWVANARIRHLREEAVDDAVMLALRDDADHYAPTLLEVARLAFRRPLLTLGLVGIMESRSALRQRIERLVDFRAPRKAGLTFASLCGIFVFSAVALPMGEAPAPPENEISSAPRTVLEKTNSPSVLIQAEIYRMPQADFKKLVSDPAFVSTRKDEVNNFHQFERLIKSSGFSPISRPRIQTTSGQPAEFYMGDETNSIDFECLPLATNGFIHLANHIKMTSTAESVRTTNKTDTQTTVQNGGGQIFSIRPPDATGQSNLVVVTVSAEIVANTPQFQQPPQTVVASAVTDAGSLAQSGKLLYEMGKFDEAEVRLKAALAANSNNAFAKDYLNLVQAAKQSQGSPATNSIHYTGQGRQAIVAKLDHIRLDNVLFDGLPLNEVLKQLAGQIRMHDPEHRGINFLIDNTTNVSGGPQAPTASPQRDPTTGLPSAPAANGEPANVGSTVIGRIDLKDARLADVLDAIVLASDHPIKYSIQDFAVVFSAKVPEIPQLFMRTFRVDSRTMISNLAAVDATSDAGTNVTAAMRKFVKQLGVNLESPPGKSIFYNDRLGVLFVKATEADLDTIERALEVLNTTPPQIHIKARFLKVPAGTVTGLTELQSVTNAAAPITGILNDGKLRTLLHSLLSRSDIEVLGEPEVTTLSGRQTQMRATAKQDIVYDVLRTKEVETGPILDVVPYVLSDGYTINLALIPSLTEFLGYDNSTNAANPMPRFRTRQVVTTLNLWDNQTVLLGGLPEKDYVGETETANTSKPGDKELLVLVTATIVDPAGNRVHTDDETPKHGPEQPPPPPKQPPQPK